MAPDEERELGGHGATSGSCTVSGVTAHITGVGSCTVTASQAGLDAYDIAASAPKPWYPADNVARTFATIYPYSGFFQPVDNGKLNLSQAGSAVPVKFTLGGDQGLAIFAAGYPKSSPQTCSTAQPADPVEETVTAGQSSLAYDPLTQQYIYVWKTEKAWAGTCRQLQVKPADDTVHVASFQFKK